MPTVTDVLNPMLHNRLVREFGNVRIRHAGQARIATAVFDVIRQRPREDIRQHGE